MSQYTLSQRNQLAKQLVSLEQEWKSIKTNQVYGTVQGRLYHIFSDRFEFNLYETVGKDTDFEVKFSEAPTIIVFRLHMYDEVGRDYDDYTYEELALRDWYPINNNMGYWFPNDSMDVYTIPCNISQGGRGSTIPSSAPYYYEIEVIANTLPIDFSYTIPSYIIQPEMQEW